MSTSPTYIATTSHQTTQYQATANRTRSARPTTDTNTMALPSATLTSSSAAASSPATATATASPSHRYAQQLNNSAALCIEIGHFGRAISSLQRALELNKNHAKGWKDQGQEVCKCYKCTLDGCIAYSENTPSEATNAVAWSSSSQSNVNGSSNSNSCENKRRRICLSPRKYSISAFWRPPAHYMEQHEQEQNDKENVTVTPVHNQNAARQPLLSQEDQEEDSCSGGYIYRRPIRVSCEGHAMGSTLYLIVTFNLALAHHLQAISYINNKQRRTKFVNRTLVLYELTYKWQLKLLCTGNKENKSSSSSPSSSTATATNPERSQSSFTAVTSIRFNMIIRNNLSQIHRLVGNHSKHKRCLQHLLSTVMVVTEYKSRSVPLRVPSRNRNNNSTHEHEPKDPRLMELDGFLQNTYALILQEGHCAKAA